MKTFSFKCGPALFVFNQKKESGQCMCLKKQKKYSRFELLTRLSLINLVNLNNMNKKYNDNKLINKNN